MAQEGMQTQRQTLLFPAMEGGTRPPWLAERRRILNNILPSIIR
jgi:hypothetical protein